MTWVIWRQHRVEAVCAALGCVAATFILFYSIQLADSVRVSLSSVGQSDALVAFGDRVGAAATTTTFALLCLPVLVGMFIGAPLFARDFEHGTYRLLLTQSITRRKWFWMTSALLLVPIAATAAWLGVLGTRWSEALGSLSNQWYQFDEQGLAFASYVVFALSLGLSAGVLLRRAVPAMAAAAAAYVAVRAFVEVFMRPQLQPAVRIGQDAPIPDGSWVFSNTAYTDSSGRTVSADKVNQLLQSAGAIPGTVADYLHAHGISSWVYYQPPGRFWAFQAEEALIFLVLAAVLVGVAAFVVQSRSD